MDKKLNCLLGILLDNKYFTPSAVPIIESKINRIAELRLLLLFLMLLIKMILIKFDIGRLKLLSTEIAK
jgi:hypothetical protein